MIKWLKVLLTNFTVVFNLFFQAPLLKTSLMCIQWPKSKHFFQKGKSKVVSLKFANSQIFGSQTLPKLEFWWKGLYRFGVLYLIMSLKLWWCKIFNHSSVLGLRKDHTKNVQQCAQFFAHFCKMTGRPPTTILIFLTK